MRDPSFVGYVRAADFHDATVLDVETIGDVVRVRVRGYDEKIFISAFSRVRAIRATHPEGMLLYALSEMRREPPLRDFVFTNWHDDDEASLEIDAEGMRVYNEPASIA